MTSGGKSSIISSGGDDLIKYDRIFEEAKNGIGKRTSTYKALAELSDSGLNKSIQSFQDNISEHQARIANPYKYVSDWDNRDERYKSGLVKFWRKEIKNQKEQLEIAKRIKKER